jgi:hypothetical protein
MPRHKTKIKVVDGDNLAVAEEIPIFEIDPEDPLLKEDKSADIEKMEDILDQTPIYSEENSIEDLSKRNKDFYERTSRKVFKTVFKEEQLKLNELAETTYYPENKEEEIDNLTLVKIHLNLIK